MNTISRRHGFTLLLAVIVTTTLGSLLVFLALGSAQFRRDQQVDRVRGLARAVADSAVAYARVHLPEWTATVPSEPIILDVQALLPPRVAGSATIQFVPSGEHLVCRVSADVQMQVFSSSEQIDLPTSIPAARRSNDEIPMTKEAQMTEPE